MIDHPNPTDNQNNPGAGGARSAAARSAKTKRSLKGQKVSRRLVALSAAAILAVYAVGYAQTLSATSPTVTPALPLAATASPRSASAPSSSTTAATATSGATTSTYEDGTYTGVGTSRHGGIQATVVIQGGKIVSANITGSSTRYPTSAIAILPGEVVTQQSTNVDYVSGATDSSMAYLEAVANALAQAQTT